MGFVPITSATCLRRAASSSIRFASSNAGGGGVMRINGSGELLVFAPVLTGGNEKTESRAPISVKTDAEPMALLLIIFNSLMLCDWDCDTRIQDRMTAFKCISGTTSFAKRFLTGWNHLDSAVGPGHDARTVRLNHYPRAVWQVSDCGHFSRAGRMAGLPAARIPQRIEGPLILRRRSARRRRIWIATIRISVRVMRYLPVPFDLGLAGQIAFGSLLGRWFGCRCTLAVAFCGLRFSCIGRVSRRRSQTKRRRF